MRKRSEAVDMDEVMYSCGIDILHPGGLAKSEEMAQKCGAGAGKRLLDIGSGKGATACLLSEKYGCRVTGIDQSAAMIEAASNRADTGGLAEHTDFIRADALRLPFEDKVFDIVLIECVTTLLDKKKAFREFLRVLKPGGSLGDLEMTWQKPPPPELRALLMEIWGGFETMTEAGWREYFTGLGLENVTSDDFSALIPDMEKKMMENLGAKGLMKLGCRLISRPALLRAMLDYRKIFSEYEDYLGYAYFTGCSPSV